jgi:hypothetical protein
MHSRNFRSAWAVALDYGTVGHLLSLSSAISVASTTSNADSHGSNRLLAFYILAEENAASWGVELPD